MGGVVILKVEKMLSANGQSSAILVDENYKVVEEVSLFLRSLEQKGKSYGTIESYCRDLKEYYRWLTKKNLKFYDVRPRMMFSWIDFLDNEVGRGRRKSPHTINRYLATISSFYRFHETMQGHLELIEDLPEVKPKEKNWFQKSVYNHPVSPKQVNPSEFKRDTVDNSRTKRLFSKEVTQLFNIFDTFEDKWELNVRNKLMFRLLYETGVRIGECLGLRLCDYSEPNPTEDFGSISVVKRRDAYHKDHYVKTVSREITVSMELIFAIDDYVCNFRPQKDKRDTIFVSHRGAQSGMYMTRQPIEALYQKISEKTGIKCTPHMLRHTHGTELAEAGYDQLYLKSRLGHRSLESTKKYVHLSLKAQTVAYNRFMQQRGSAVLR